MKSQKKTLVLSISTSPRTTLYGKVTSYGGVIVFNKDNSIMCKNTLDLRMQIAFEKQMPEIRKIMQLQD